MKRIFKIYKKVIKKIFIFLLFLILYVILYELKYNNNKNKMNIKINNDIEKVDSKYEIINNANKAIVGISKKKYNYNNLIINDGNIEYGSGFFISPDGYILTNQHVAGSKNEIDYIILDNGDNSIGKVIWSDADLDLAIVKIKLERKYDFIKLGDSDKIKVGENVYAIGNPLGIDFQKTVTSGIISGVDRFVTIKNKDNSISYMEDMIQTDANINNGNSGGPLINMNGDVIGINTVKIDMAEGMGFAVPINLLNGIIKKINNNEEINNISIGIYAYDKDIVKTLDTNINFNNGIYVAKVKNNSIAYRNGIKEGDIITNVDGFSINKMNDLRKYLFKKNKGDIIKLVLLNNNAEKKIYIKL